MELLRALVISSIYTTILLALLLILDKKRRKVEVRGPFIYLRAYKLDAWGALKEVPTESIPKKITEKLQQEAIGFQQKVLNEIKRSETMRKLNIIIFALAIYIMQVIIWLSLPGT
ncbi:MAG: hypothetical protein NDP22_01775 [Crenarchaeota archaeon]|nr:hypothetical protein [Thermoproteota archaeon]